ncbi:unnamed protein product [Mesocestoides corti]|uniref:HD/PDEase domain-containing protein n=1 Tax=Mesocestoides corti TaxID=53468 RepID=A0A158QUG4_MESCO|nr:unnamed protein product [Mesocestoides corti]
MITNKKPTKIIQDAVHGIVEVEGLLMRFIDTPEFQRLRRLNQVGVTRYVYPVCTHTRFEHSLGTYHLTKRLLDAIQADLSNEVIRLTEGECTSLMLAALCHDLGKHEEISCRIIQRIVNKDEHLRTLLNDAGVDLDLVYALIRGHATPELKIISNSLNGNDVDKWDYIMRDSFHAGLGQGSCVIELERLLRFYRPAYHASDDSWHMSFRVSELENVMRVFTQRLRLRSSVYAHKTTLAIEAMFIDIFNALDPVLHLRDLSLRAATGDNSALDAFLRMDEHCIWGIASCYSIWPFKILPDMAENLRRSACLCERIQTRQLYSIVGCFYAVREIDVVNAQEPLEVDCEALTARKIVLMATLYDADKGQKNAIQREILGTESEILEEIFAKLPHNSPVRSVRELRLVSDLQSSNSTDDPPTFFVYRTLADTFSITQPLTKVCCFLLLWSGPFQDDEDGPPLHTPSPVPPCLTEALEAWRREKVEATALRWGKLTSKL